MDKNNASNIPTLYEWIGGIEIIEKWIVHFYNKIVKDKLLQPLFEDMSLDHQKNVAKFLAEVFGGPAEYTKSRGGHPAMIKKHFNKQISEKQRKQWMTLLLESADELQLPNDPEFRSAIVSYLEWGTRLAMINSQPGVNPDVDEPMPKWGWGEVGGPYQQN